MSIDDIKKSLAALQMEGIEVESVQYSADAGFSFESPTMMATLDAQWFKENGFAPFYRVVCVGKPAPGSLFHTEVWLPEEGWNGNLVMVGNGSGASVLVHNYMLSVASEPYVVVHCDLGTSLNLD